MHRAETKPGRGLPRHLQPGFQCASRDGHPNIRPIKMQVIVRSQNGWRKAARFAAESKWLAESRAFCGRIHPRNECRAASHSQTIEKPPLIHGDELGKRSKTASRSLQRRKTYVNPPVISRCLPRHPPRAHSSNERRKPMPRIHANTPRATKRRQTSAACYSHTQSESLQFH